jgi:hypothetical protein
MHQPIEMMTDPWNAETDAGRTERAGTDRASNEGASRQTHRHSVPDKSQYRW